MTSTFHMVYSAFMKGHAEVKLALQKAEEIVLNPVILGELRAGFRAGNRFRKNERELQIFSSSPRVRFIDITQETAERYPVIVHFLRKAGTLSLQMTSGLPLAPWSMVCAS